jgi:phosphoribosyl 1,2-cyclic phosphate phosphodiesterase
MIGCACRVCRSSDPRDQRMRSSIYVQTPEYSWVVDTGPDFRSQCLRHGVSAVDAVVYTHAHTDHIMGFDDLRPFCPRDGELPIYASAETLGHLQRIFEFAFNGLNRFPGYMRPAPHTVNGPFLLGATELTPLRLPHGRTTVTGYLLRRAGVPLAAYLSDCKEVPAPVIEQIAGVKHLIVDALRKTPHPTHMNVTEALAVVEKVRPGRAWFTHLCHELAHGELEAELPAAVGVAWDGLKIEI